MSDIQRLPQPPDLDRVESGVVQFGDDWPGLFLRGDHALHFGHYLSLALNEGLFADDLIHRAVMEGLRDDLMSVHASLHRPETPDGKA